MRVRSIMSAMMEENCTIYVRKRDSRKIIPRHLKYMAAKTAVDVSTKRSVYINIMPKNRGALSNEKENSHRKIRYERTLISVGIFLLFVERVINRDYPTAPYENIVVSGIQPFAVGEFQWESFHAWASLNNSDSIYGLFSGPNRNMNALLRHFW